MLSVFLSIPIAMTALLSHVALTELPNAVFLSASVIFTTLGVLVLILLGFKIIEWLETTYLHLTLPGSILAFLAGVPLFPTVVLMFLSIPVFLPLALLGVLLLLALYLPSAFLRLMFVRTDPEVRFYLEYRREFGYPGDDEVPTIEEVLPVLRRLTPRPETVLRHSDVVKVFGGVRLTSFRDFLDLEWVKDPGHGIVEGAQRFLALIALATSGELEEDRFWEAVNGMIATHGLIEIYYFLSRLARLECDHPEVELARRAVETLKESILGPLA